MLQVVHRSVQSDPLDGLVCRHSHCSCETSCTLNQASQSCACLQSKLNRENTLRIVLSILQLYPKPGLILLNPEDLNIMEACSVHKTNPNAKKMKMQLQTVITVLLNGDIHSGDI